MEKKIHGPKKRTSKEIRYKILDSLLSLKEGERLSFGDIMKKTDLAPPVLSSHIKKLEEEGIIESSSVPEDRRKRVYSLASKWEDTDHHKQVLLGLVAFRTYQRVFKKLLGELKLEKDVGELSRNELINYAASGAGLLQLLQQEQAMKEDVTKGIEIYINLIGMGVALAFKEFPKVEKAWQKQIETLPKVEASDINVLLDIITQKNSKAKEFIKQKILSSASR